MTIPYATATSDMRAVEEVKKILRRFGCSEVGISDKHETNEVFLYFIHRGCQVRLTVSAKGWAAMWLKENPWTYHRRTKRHDYEQGALRQGHIAVNSILRDWVKAQITIIESGIVSFEDVFMPFMLMNDGRTALEYIKDTKMLPAPDEPKVVQLPPKKQDGDH